MSIVVVGIVSSYQHMRAHSMSTKGHEHKNKMCPGRHCTVMSVDFLMTQKIQQVKYLINSIMHCSHSVSINRAAILNSELSVV